MINRRTFAALVAGSIAASRKSWGQTVKGKTVFYASVGPDLALYDIDVEGASLTKRNAVRLPADVQYAWPHPSKRFFYAASSNGQPGGGAVNQGDKHFASAFRVDPASGALTAHGPSLTLQSRPIHISVDGGGEYALIAYNDPSSVTVHRINKDGTLGELVNQVKPDVGITRIKSARPHPPHRDPGHQAGNNAAAGNRKIPAP
jgi:6-phosphogluconolactonase (cycloisomerase 2 family)